MNWGTFTSPSSIVIDTRVHTCLTLGSALTVKADNKEKIEKRETQKQEIWRKSLRAGGQAHFKRKSEHNI